MASTGVVQQFLLSLLSSSPYLLMLLGGMVMGVIHMSRHRQSGFFIVIGTVVLLFNAVVLTGLQMWSMRVLPGGGGISPMWFVYLLGAMRSAVSALGVGLLIASGMVGRSLPTGEKARMG